MFPRSLLRKIAPFWVLAILVISFLPGKAKGWAGSLTDFEKAAAGQVRWQHRAMHFAVFGLTGVLFSLLTRTPGQRAAAFAAGILLACGIEAGESLVFGQGLEWWDIRDDSMAITVGSLAAIPHSVRRWLVLDVRSAERLRN